MHKLYYSFCILNLDWFMIVYGEITWIPLYLYVLDTETPHGLKLSIQTPSSIWNKKFTNSVNGMRGNDDSMP